MKVDFLNHPGDLQVLVLGRLGFSTEFIAQRTKLTIAQVLYRLARGNVKRGDYRSGKSDTCKMVFDMMLPSITTKMRRNLKP